MKKVRKAIIPAAGYGTRFLPATKALPKEMLPIIDTPTIQYIVEEAVKAGIEDIIIVTGKQKRAIEDHFDRNVFRKLIFHYYLHTSHILYYHFHSILYLFLLHNHFYNFL